MLTLPSTGARGAYLIGLDPGSIKLGCGLLYIDCYSLEIYSSTAFTLRGDWMARNSWQEAQYGNRLSRIDHLRAALIEVFRQYQVVDIASESPFMSITKPSAYGALTEVICAIREATWQYDPWKTLTLIDPPTVKNAVGAAGNAGKDPVREGIARLRELNLQVPLDALDEHAVDALAVCYARLAQLRLR